MKKYNLKCKVLGLMVAVLTLMSCGDQNEVFQKYLDQGERIYISIADSLTVFPGNQRAKVKFLVDDDPKLKDCVVKWNDGDSVIVPIDKTGSQWLSTTINNLQEGEAHFTVYTRDIYGNQSLPSEMSKKIYGSDYASELVNRSVASVEAVSPSRAKISWYSMTNCIGVNMSYTDKEGKNVKKFIPGDEQETILENVQLGTEFSFTSLYVPIENCIDTFEVAEKSTYKLPEGFMLDTSSWTITASSDASHRNDGGKPEVLLDGNLDNYWHSSWSPNAPLPHWLLIDMKEMNTVIEVSVYKRSNNTDCKKVEVYTSEDGESFDHVGDIEYEQTPTPQGKTLVLEHAVKARYLKCVITESYREPFVSLAEIRVMGR